MLQVRQTNAYSRYTRRHTCHRVCEWCICRIMSRLHGVRSLSSGAIHARMPRDDVSTSLNASVALCWWGVEAGGRWIFNFISFVYGGLMCRSCIFDSFTGSVAFRIVCTCSRIQCSPIHKLCHYMYFPCTLPRVQNCRWQ